MSNFTRRAFLGGLAAAAFAPSVLRSRPASAVSLRPCGCCLRGGTVGALTSRPPGMVAPSSQTIELTLSSGDAVTDQFLGAALLGLAETFKVHPGFGFYDNSRSPNALAAPDAVMPGTFGTVIMGKRLFIEEMANNDAGMTVIAICAHEFGHIHQFQHGYHEQLAQLDSTARPIELHADFLAGVFLATRKKEHPDLDLFAVGETFNRLGDTDFRNPQHHGTAQERTAAITAGFERGRGGVDDIDKIALAGVEYVRRAV